jgi:hypothetical protein
MNKNYFMLMNENLLGDGGGATPPAPVAPPTPPSVTIPDNWKEALPQDIRGEKSFEHIKTFEDMAKSYLNAQKMMGADKVVIPHKNAEKSEWEKVFQKLGRPESADKYEINLGEKGKLPAETIANLKKTAFELGLLPSQAVEFVNKMNESFIQAEDGLKNKVNTQMQDAVTSLKKEWGTEFDKRLNTAKAMVAEFGGEELQQYLTSTGYGNDPMLVKAFYNIASQFGEDKFKGIDSSIGGMTPDAAMRRINELNADPAFMDASHPKHKDVIAERSKMFRYAYPEEKK